MHISSFKWYYFAFGALTALTVFYASYKLTESPPTWFDEGIYVQVAQNIVEHGVQAIQTEPGVFEPTGHVTGGYPFLAPVALSLTLLGNSLFAARVPLVVFIILCVLAAWLLISKLYGPRAALLAMALLSTFPLLYGNGKNVLGEVPGMLYVLLSLYFLWQIERREFKGVGWYMLAGLFVGLASATKPIFFLLPIAVGIVFLFTIRSKPWSWRGVVLGTVASIVPLVVWAYLQFGSADAISSVLFHYANPYAKASLVGTVLHNLPRFFTEVTPLYCATLVGAWLVAVGIRMYRTQQIQFAEWAAFAFSMLIILAYMRTEGWYRYFFEAMILGLIFLPLSLHTIAKELERHSARIQLGWLVPTIVVLLSMMQLYQLNYSSWVADHYASTQTSELEAYFASHVQQGSVFVYNAPDIVPFLRTSNYYQYFDIEPTGALAYGKDTLSVLATGVPAEVFTTPAMYQQHMSLFTGYSKGDMVGGYIVLHRN